MNMIAANYLTYYNPFISRTKTERTLLYMLIKNNRNRGATIQLSPFQKSKRNENKEIERQGNHVLDLTSVKASPKIPNKVINMKSFVFAAKNASPDPGSKE